MKARVLLGGILLIFTFSLNVNAHFGETKAKTKVTSTELTVGPKVSMNFSQCVNQLISVFKMTANAAGAKCTEWGYLVMDTNTEATPESTEVAL